MRRFLVVGCGGSGGATLAYLMDQLRSDLASHGVGSLPPGWQFVHIDVPTGSEPGPEGLSNVQQQGGTYVPTGPNVPSYKVLDTAVSNTLRSKNALAEIATWAPRDPDQVSVPIADGAGQYRALGRMITLGRAGDVRRALTAAWQRLNTVETISEMGRLQRVPGLGSFDPQNPAVVLVVSSMAGGAGASMALDVCRLLTLVDGVDPGRIAVFMASPDIFDALPAAARSGVRANALAMLGEIIAAQSGSARGHDATVMSALGQGGGQGTRVPFARVFPVGRFIGAEKALFGDGSQMAVYRGLGRALAGLMTSGQATQDFVAFDLTNGVGLKNESRYLNWGVQNHLEAQWGSFGFASLSMGRDRYAEYAAQRLARSTVDHLLKAHTDPGSTASEAEQVRALVESHWGNACRLLGLPVETATGAHGRPQMGPWLVDVAFPRATAEEAARSVVREHLSRHIPSPNGIHAAQWTPALRNQLALRRSAVLTASNTAAYAWAHAWQHELLRRLVAVADEAVTAMGLRYAVTLLGTLAEHVRDVVIPGAAELALQGPVDVVALPPEVENLLAGLRGVISNGQHLVDRLTDGVTRNVRDQIWSRAAHLVQGVLGSFLADVVQPLEQALRSPLLSLEQEVAAPVTDLGLARLAVDQYGAWPSDDDALVAARFTHANNEVLLTSSADFQPRYTVDIQASASRQPAESTTFPDARNRAVRMVVSGHWPTVGGAKEPGSAVQLLSGWNAPVFVTAPASGETLVHSRARFAVSLSPREILGRARQFVARPGESFSTFCELSLRDYIAGGDVSEPAQAQRMAEVVGKFQQALSLARPLISADQTAVEMVHGEGLSYQYKFSEIPFEGLPVAGSVEKNLSAPLIDPTTSTRFRAALSIDDQIKRIDVFGSYPKYSPLVFDAVLQPVIDQWNSTDGNGHALFWRWRRSRPLPASLPMADSERRAMVAGWFVGQVVGSIQIPAPPYTSPVQVWDDEHSRWEAFPHPLLTPPSGFLAPYDWLPAVLESALLAIARSHEPPMMHSLRPYQLLRGLWDDSDNGPADGILQRSGVGTLARWLTSGLTSGTVDRRRGGASRVPGVDAAASLDERKQLTVDWLTRIQSLAGTHFLPPGEHGAPGGGQFSTVTNRQQAGQVPIFRDVAADVYWATGEIIEIVEKVTDVEAGPSVPGLPDGGVF
ncbi:MAG: tubulin-like doman-containing protein [Actinomycetes bacterium]